MKAKRPTNGSVAILKANAAKGSAIEGLRYISSSVSGSIPFTASISRGEGMNAQTASKSA